MFAAEENADTQACNYARRSNDVKVWEAYLRKFPKGTCAFIAETELEKHGIPIPNGQVVVSSTSDIIPCARGCIDTETGYMWSTVAVSTMTPSKAKDYCENLQENGHSDWHLPTLNVLKTISGNRKSKFGDTEYFCSSSCRNLDFETGKIRQCINPYFGTEDSCSVRCFR